MLLLALYIIRETSGGLHQCDKERVRQFEKNLCQRGQYGDSKSQPVTRNDVHAYAPRKKRLQVVPLFRGSSLAERWKLLISCGIRILCKAQGCLPKHPRQNPSEKFFGQANQANGKVKIGT